MKGLGLSILFGALGMTILLAVALLVVHGSPTASLLGEAAVIWAFLSALTYLVGVFCIRTARLPPYIAFGLGGGVSVALLLAAHVIKGNPALPFLSNAIVLTLFVFAVVLTWLFLVACAMLAFRLAPDESPGRFAPLTLLAVGIAGAAWFLTSGIAMKPYPLLDPNDLVGSLPNLPKRDTAGISDSRFFDQYGYLKGEKGTRIAILMWTKRETEDPYDVDLLITITATPSPTVAEEGLLLSQTQDTKIGGKLDAVDPPFSAYADRFTVHRLQAKSMPLSYIVNARHGNYFFRFLARIVPGGYFENEEQLFERLETLNAQIDTTLEASR